MKRQVRRARSRCRPERALLRDSGAVSWSRTGEISVRIAASASPSGHDLPHAPFAATGHRYMYLNITKYGDACPRRMSTMHVHSVALQRNAPGAVEQATTLEMHQST